jgi:hypothetical protein
MNHFFTNCTKNKYATIIISRATKNMGGGITNLKYCPKGVKGIMSPMVTIYTEVNIKNWLGLLSRKGILPVRITCMTNVWVHSDSKNQPVLKRAWCA